MRNIADCGFYRCAFRALHSHILKSASVECGKRSGTVIPHSALPIPHWEVESNHLPKNNCSLFYFLLRAGRVSPCEKLPTWGQKSREPNSGFQIGLSDLFSAALINLLNRRRPVNGFFQSFFDLKKNEGNLKADPPGRKRFFNYF
jgi:hypothetical protein